MEKLHEVLPCGNTPFSIIKGYRNDESDDIVYFVVCGKHRISEFFDTEEEALNDSMEISWARIGALIESTVEFFNEEKKKNEVN